ncbi:uncharacterized protein LOC105661919 [Megachile rotundata]|uniref:uncharacterized protein LOC105661919 n=1 Tax=Megachile rotundata TaxID=143995 RepID=UPI000615371B|nr:PREDICTED: serine protease inhibitor 3-like [Megachile rotundata]
MAKFFAFLLLLAFVCLLSDAASIKSGEDDAIEEGRKCVSGASYYDGCNWCQCHHERHISCTYKLCTVLNPETGNMEQAKLLPPPDSFWAKD